MPDNVVHLSVGSVWSHAESGAGGGGGGALLGYAVLWHVAPYSGRGVGFFERYSEIGAATLLLCICPALLLNIGTIILFFRSLCDLWGPGGGDHSFFGEVYLWLLPCLTTPFEATMQGLALCKKQLLSSKKKNCCHHPRCVSEKQRRERRQGV